MKFSYVLVPLLIAGSAWLAFTLDAKRSGLDPDVTSAFLQIGMGQPVPLKPDSAKALSAWLTQQADGWHSVPYTPPPSDRWITLVYGDRKQVRLALHLKTIIAYGADEKGLKARSASSGEIAELLSLFGGD